MYYKIINFDKSNCGNLQNDLDININMDDMKANKYFTKIEYIFKFLNDGNYLAEIGIPNNITCLKKVEKDKWYSDKIKIGNCYSLCEVSTFKLLIDGGANISDYGESAFKWACLNGYHDIILYLIMEGANYHIRGGHFMDMACDNGFLDYFRNKINSDTNIYNEYVLRKACQYGYLDIVKFMVDHAANGHFNYLRSISKYNTHDNILNASKNGHLEIIKYLVECGYVLNTNNCKVPMFYASSGGYLEIIKYFDEKNVDLHVNNEYSLNFACMKGHLEIVKFFIEEKGFNVNSIYDDSSFPLYWASKNGHLDIVIYLIEKGADIHLCNDIALCYACENGNYDIAKYIIGKKDNIYANNQMAIKKAFENKHYDIVKLLSDSGSNIDVIYDDYIHVMVFIFFIFVPFICFITCIFMYPRLFFR